jgi:hypothetical protein
MPTRNDVMAEQQRAPARKDLRATPYAYHASGTVPFVEVVNASEGDAPCRACQELHGRRFAIEDAIARAILPCAECTGGSGAGCRCQFLPVQDQRKRARDVEAPPSWFKRLLDF